MRFSILRKGIFSILCLARSGHGHFSVGQMRSCAGHIMVRRSLEYVSVQFILWFVKNASFFSGQLVKKIFSGKKEK